MTYVGDKLFLGAPCFFCRAAQAARQIVEASELYIGISKILQCLSGLQARLARVVKEYTVSFVLRPRPLYGIKQGARGHPDQADRSPELSDSGKAQPAIDA